MSWIERQPMLGRFHSDCILASLAGLYAKGLIHQLMKIFPSPTRPTMPSHVR
jgi:hypothetical protein